MRCAMLNAASAVLWPMLRVLPLLHLLRYGLSTRAVFAIQEAEGFARPPANTHTAYAHAPEGTSSTPDPKAADSSPQSAEA